MLREGIPVVTNSVVVIPNCVGKGSKMLVSPGSDTKVEISSLATVVLSKGLERREVVIVVSTLTVVIAGCVAKGSKVLVSPGIDTKVVTTSLATVDVNSLSRGLEREETIVVSTFTDSVLRAGPDVVANSVVVIANGVGKGLKMLVSSGLDTKVVCTSLLATVDVSEGLER